MKTSEVISTERNTTKMRGILFAIGFLAILSIVIYAFTNIFMMIINKFN